MTERYEHRRTGDRELLGWLRAEGDDYVAVDLLGRELTDAVDWPTAEEALDARGLRWLSDLWQLRLDDGSVERVRIVEVRPDDRVVVKRDDLGAVGAEQVVHVLPFPAPAALQPFAGDPHVLG
ncbi:hypothetical protein [Cellulomonas alba]|uniref:hypothetical protein n=1 Tax=Cellulomonas alba TaxID=3053467 RepID=UPI003899518F